METRTLCPNCNHEKYIALKVENQFGTLRLKSILSDEGLRIDMERLTRIFGQGDQFTIIKDPKFTVLTPLVNARRADKTIPCPGKCPDCNNPVVREGKTKTQMVSHKALGYLSLVFLIQHKDDAAIRSAIFPDVEHTLKVRFREGVVEMTVSLDAPVDDDVPTAPVGKGTPLDALREQAVMDGIEGAENMDAKQIAAARKKLQAAGSK